MPLETLKTSSFWLWSVRNFTHLLSLAEGGQLRFVLQSAWTSVGWSDPSLLIVLSLVYLMRIEIRHSCILLMLICKQFCKHICRMFHVQGTEAKRLQEVDCLCKTAVPKISFHGRRINLCMFKWQQENSGFVDNYSQPYVGDGLCSQKNRDCILALSFL